MGNPRHTARFDLTGKSALVVGAAGTFGRAGAFALGEAGGKLTVADQDTANINAVAGDLSDAGIAASAVALWPDCEANAAKIVQAAVDAHGRLDIVFIALGTNDVAFVEDQSEDGWRKVMTVFRSPVSEWMFDEEGPGKTVRDNMLQRIPIGRLGDVDDLMGGLVYLSSPASDFMTGQTIYIDGGYTAI